MVKVVTVAGLQRALDRAVSDFTVCGLYTEALHQVPVWLTWIGTAYGWCAPSGDISIPAVSLSRLAELFGRPRVALTDLVRHEMAHALAHVHPGLVDTAAFRSVFGGDYWDNHSAEYDHDLYVSRYACMSPAEDFAETVMVYTRHRGRVDRYRHREGVMSGCEFVAELARRFDRSGLAIG